jgi:hypothetical protein
MAISAAHCACNFELVQTSVSCEGAPLKFLEIPQQLTGYVIGAGLLPNFIFGHSRSRADCDDVAVVYLKSFPPGVDLSIIPEWRQLTNDDHPLRGAVLGGLSLSGSQHGPES